MVTGGEGDLAGALRLALEAGGFEVLAPGRGELDVRSAGSVDAYFAELGRLDLLVNNAGITRDALFPRQTPEDWDEVVAANLSGAWRCSVAAGRLMAAGGPGKGGTPRGNGGHIVQIGSYSAVSPPLGQTAYAAAKAGLVGLTKSLAREWGADGIRVNCVLPGFLETKMTSELSPQARERALREHQLGRFNTVAEAARFVAFLATCEHVSGQVFQLDSRV